MRRALKIAYNSMQAKKKIVFIGFGRRGKTIYGSLSGNPMVEVAGVFDVDLNCEVPQRVRRYDSIGEMLREQKPDLAIVTTPPRHHISCLRQCNAYNVAVLCEKPLVTRTSHLQELREFTIKIYAAYQFNYDSLIQKAIELASDQKIYSIVASQRVLLRPEGWKKDRRISGGGTLIDNSSHFINLAIKNYGNPRRVFSFLDADKTSIEMQSDTVLFYDAFSFKIHSDWMSSVGKENKLIIHGAREDIYYLEDNNSVELYTLRSEAAAPWTIKTKKLFYRAKGLERNIKKDPFNVAASQSALANMLDRVLSDLKKPKTKFYNTQYFAAIQTSNVIDKIYKNPGKVINI